MRQLPALGFTHKQLDARFALELQLFETGRAAINRRTEREDEKSLARITVIQARAVTAAAPHSQVDEEEPLGEISPATLLVASRYPGLPKAEIARSFVNKFRLENLHKLRHLKGREESSSRPSTNHPNPDKFNGDKTKLEAFVTQLRIKLQRNADHFTRPAQDTEQNRLSYAISRLEGDAFLQVEPLVSRFGIDLIDVAALEDLLETQFGEVDPVATAKHEMYRLYQANKDLEVFFNTFLVLAKKAKFDEQQTLDLLYEKLSDKFKNLLVTKKRQTNLDDRIKKL